MFRWKPIVFGAAGGFALLGGLQAIGSGMAASNAEHQREERMAKGSEADAPAAASNSAEGGDGHPQRLSAAPINSAATMAYTTDMFPALVRKFGAAIPVIERERNMAAQIAAMDTHCDEVMNVQITTGSTSNNRRYYADCKNRTRIFFDANSIASGNPTGLQTWGAILADGLEDW